MKLIAPLTCLLSLIASASIVASEAEDAWYGISMKKKSEKKSDPFRYVENRSDLPNVLIYGDSISIAYTSTVRAELEGKANVYRIHVNGGDSSSFIPKMDTMHETMRDYWTHDWDVIHFNVGLHDLKYVVNGKLDKVNGKQVSSLVEYEKNLHAIVVYLKALAPNAKLVFALTTPVPEGESGRQAGSALEYNKVAIKVMEKYGIAINDLFFFTKARHSEWWSKPGNVHYNAEGIKAQGEQVARLLSKLLGLDAILIAK